MIKIKWLLCILTCLLLIPLVYGANIDCKGMGVEINKCLFVEDDLFVKFNLNNSNASLGLR